MTEETAEEKLERLLEAERVSVERTQYLWVLIGGIVVIILAILFCF